MELLRAQLLRRRSIGFARGDQNELPGFDENAYAAASPAAGRPLAEVLEDLTAVRRATISLLRSLEPEAGNVVSVRAMAHVMVGHVRHHLNVLRERYLTA